MSDSSPDGSLYSVILSYPDEDEFEASAHTSSRVRELAADDKLKRERLIMLHHKLMENFEKQLLLSSKVQEDRIKMKKPGPLRDSKLQQLECWAARAAEMLQDKGGECITVITDENLSLREIGAIIMDIYKEIGETLNI